MSESCSTEPIENNLTLNLRPFIRARLEPQPDMTAFELLSLLPYIIGGKVLHADGWEKLGSATRHLKPEQRL